jgi:hypothetical protein
LVLLPVRPAAGRRGRLLVSVPVASMATHDAVGPRGALPAGLLVDSSISLLRTWSTSEDQQQTPGVARGPFLVKLQVSVPISGRALPALTARAAGPPSHEGGNVAYESGCSSAARRPAKMTSSPRSNASSE